MIIIVIEIMKNYGIYENSEIDLDYYSVIVILKAAFHPCVNVYIYRAINRSE